MDEYTLKNEKPADYSVEELMSRLEEDDSWETDEVIRKKTVQLLRRKLSDC